MKIAWVVVTGSLLCFSLHAFADDKCPSSVRSAVEKSFPGSEVKKCEIQTEKGRQVYEVKLKTKDGHVSKMDIDPQGLVLLTSQYVETGSVPPAVMKSFKDKYPNDRIVRTEQVTYPDGRTTYRIVYDKDNGQRAVVYTPEGNVVEETQAYNDDGDVD